MPTRTAARPSTRPGDPTRGRASGLIAAAGLFAVAELGLAVTIGGFFTFGRAEALVFLAFRPWLLLLLACALARRDWRMRTAGYALALCLATAGESVFLHILGAADRLWSDALAGLVAGGLLALLLDLLVQLGRRAGGWLGPAVGFAAGAALLLIPGGLFFYDRILIDRAAPPAEGRPELMLMTALPIIWGEGGAFDPEARPAESYRALRREFRVRPLDTLSPETLTGRLLLLAQPRALAPEELVALDDWVRRGGRALILTDPALDWPSALPLGDIRRPPSIGLLGPLLTHWGILLDPRTWAGPAITHVAVPGRTTRLAMTKPGRFEAPDCRRPLPDPFLIACEVGKGKAMLVADADLLRDDLWAPFGPARHQRIADNPLVVAAWLDGLAGIERPRIDGEVEWLDADAPRGRALALGLAPAGLALLLAAGLGRRRRR